MAELRHLDVPLTGGEVLVEEADAHVRDILANGGVVYGFGHGVLRAEDPRTLGLFRILFSFALLTKSRRLNAA